MLADVTVIFSLPTFDRCSARVTESPGCTNPKFNGSGVSVSPLCSAVPCMVIWIVPPSLNVNVRFAWSSIEGASGE